MTVIIMLMCEGLPLWTFHLDNVLEVTSELGRNESRCNLLS